MRRFAPPVPGRYALRVCLGALTALLLSAAFALVQVSAQGQAQPVPLPGRNVNMVSGNTWPDGDPFLQRQNEPSIAASTRNPLHLLAGSNDYRTIDLPGLPDGDETGDAWVGLYKSLDGGQRWTSGLIPGYPQDQSPDGLASPLKGYQAAADPVVRAGISGLVFYSGLVFDREEDGKSAIFVSRFIDENNQEAGDPFTYLGTTLVAKSNGSGGRFLDKPWMAVDLPRPGARGKCEIPLPPRVKKNGKLSKPKTQKLDIGNVYVAYTSITGDGDTLKSEIYLHISEDCGKSWGRPILLSSPSDRVNQGAMISVDPSDGDVFVTWRRFGLAAGESDGIMVYRLPRSGRGHGPKWARKFKTWAWERDRRVFEHRKRRLTEAAPLDQFDQSTTTTRFRTNAYPTATVDETGRLYVAWSERGFAQLRPDLIDGDARIVLVTSVDGDEFSEPQVIDEGGQPGHQLMPTIAFAGGRLMLVYYDVRETRAQTFGPFVSDANLAIRQTMDIRAAMGTPGDPPSFSPSVKVSDYLMGFRNSSSALEQLQVNPPNLPMFRLGTVPFIGDYIDVTAAPAFISDERGRWRYNTATSVTPPVFHAVWTDNRDVRPPLDGDWTRYTPPLSPALGPVSLADPTQTPPVCVPGNAGSRNQNVYSSRITGGLVVGSPGNAKPLSPTLPRAFVVFAQNTTAQTRSFRMRIAAQPPGGRASFSQFPLPPFNAGSPAPLVAIDMRVPPRSLAARTVYVTSTDPDAQVPVEVFEIAEPGAPDPLPGGLASRTVINPDIENPDIENPDIENPDIENPDIENAEVYNPDIENPDIENPDIENPDIENPDIENPDIENVVVANPDIENVVIANPDIENPDIENPDIENPDIENPDIENGAVADITWSVTNTGNTTAAFNVNLFLSQATVPQGLLTQLVIYKTYRTPVTVPNGCELRFETRNVLITNVPNPTFIAPSGGTLPDQNDPSEKNPTLWLSPGEIGRITLRIVDNDTSNNVLVRNAKGELVSIDPAFNPEETDVTPGISSQAVASDDAAAGETDPPVVTPTGSNLFFLQQPTTTPVNTTMTPAVRVRAIDNSGAPLPGVTVSLSLNVPGVVLSGHLAVTDETGVATFGALQIDTVGTGYILTATVSGATPASAQSSAFAVVPLVLHADLDVTQSVPQPVVNVDTTIALLVTNHGPAPASGVVLTDTLPAGVTFIGASEPCSYDGDDRTVTCPLAGVIPPGESRQALIVIRPTVSAPLVNAVSVAGSQPDPAPDNNTSSEIFFVSSYAPCVAPTFRGPFVNPLNSTSTGLVETADFNGDTFPDLLFAKADGNFVLVLSDGDGGYLDPQYFAENNPTGAASADFNNDGHADVAVINQNNSGPPEQRAEFGVGLGDGTGTFTTGEDIFLPLAGTFAIATGDFNHDGHADVVVSSANANDSAIAMMLGAGDGTFTEPVPVAAGPAPGNLVLGDFNVDGHLDVAVNNVGFPTISVLHGDGDGGFSAPQTVTLAVNSQRLRQMNDVNGDGAPDLAVTTSPGGGVLNNLLLLLNDGDGGFLPPTEIIGPRGVGFSTTGDMNGDGRLDVVAIVFQENRIVILEGNGEGQFTENGSYLTGTSQNHFEIVDLNVDGRPDIVGTIRGGYYLLFNTCAGGQGASADLTSTMIGPETGAVGDLLTYTAFVANHGPDPATGVVATVVVPAGMNFIGSSLDCVVSYGTAQCHLPAIAPEANQSFTVTVQPFAAGTRVNRLMASATEPDPVSSNNVGAASTEIAAGSFTFVVTTTADAGPGSLRQAIADSNLNAGSTNQIHFNIPGGAPFVIAPQSGFGNISVPVIIDGTTQPGYSGTPLIEVTGLNAPNTNGLNITAGGSTVRGLSLTRFFPNAINVLANGNNVFEANYIGLTPAGVVAGNGNGLNLNAPNNRVGGTAPSARNVISGNTDNGILIGGQVVNGALVNTGAGTIVLGNYIGTNPAGTAAAGSAFGAAGVRVAAPSVTIGTPLGPNVISGNGAFGGGSGIVASVVVQAPGSTVVLAAPADLLVQSNVIGTNAAGTAAIPNVVGVQLNAGSGRIGGTNPGEGNVISGNAAHGLSLGVFTTGSPAVFVAAASNYVVEGNLIGTNAAGAAGLGNAVAGVFLNGVSGNTIGGAQPGARNVAAGNGQYGIALSAQSGQTTTNNRVIGNYLGTVDGATARPNGAYGVDLLGNGGTVTGNTIGGTSPGDGNLVSGNGLSGVALRGAGTSGNTVTGNRIGTIASGLGALPNATHGVFFADAVNNTIGPDNLIAFNMHSGVTVSGTGNRITSNSIHSNTILGIDLDGNNAVNPNDPGDGDVGANNRQNFPVLSNASNAFGPTTRVDVDQTSFASGLYTLQFFANTACDPSGHGEGQRLVGTFILGAAPFPDRMFLNEAVPAGQFLTATATDDQGNTSEFSACTAVAAAAPTVVTNTNDSGAGSLRGAIEAANSTPGTQTISFNIPGAGPGSPALISLTSPLPALTESVIIDGTTQPGYDGLPVVEVRSPSDTAGWIGFKLEATTITIRGLSIFRFGQGIMATDSFGNHLIEQNIIGSNRTFASGLGNTLGLYWRGSNSTISDNVISGNQEGIRIASSTGNQIRGNRIGLNKLGTEPLGNSSTGVTLLDGVSATTIVDNIISANGSWGVDIQFAGGPVTGTSIRLNRIGLDATGADAGNAGGGIRIDRAPGTVIGGVDGRNIISGNGGEGPAIGVGIQVLGTVDPAPVIQSNYIGLDPTGVLARSNNNKGISLDGRATIGGSGAGEGNYISGNGDVMGGAGIIANLGAAGSVITGNVIGLNVNHDPVGNGYSGITVRTAGAIRIGGADSQRNVISGNGVYGISVLRIVPADPLPSQATIEGNLIGTDAGGTLARGNGGAGINIEGTQHRIGGVGEGAGNVIANNGAQGGIRVIGETSQVDIIQNTIRDNSGLGIDLGGDGVTLNDAGDVDAGPNGLQNYAPITSATNSAGVTRVTIDTNELAAGNYTVQFFSAAVCDGSGFGEGDLPQMWLAGVSGGSGLQTYDLPLLVPVGHSITATITNGANQTSEFSPCRAVVAGSVATRLAFLVQPSSSMAGATIAPPIQVAIQDAAGGTVTTASDVVTLAIEDNPGGGGLLGTVTRSAVNGIATFDDLAIDRAGIGYTLAAHSGSLAAAMSQPFTIEPSVFTVTTTADSGPGSLRQAILDANTRSLGVTSTIRFNLSGDAPHTIMPASALPGITRSMVIDGTPGGVCTGVAPAVEIDGALAGAAAHGLVVNSPGVAIRGLAIGGFDQSGIFLAGGGNTLVECNYLGVAPDGTSATPNQDGVRISGSSNNTIGNAASARNVISGNTRFGVFIQNGTLNQIRENYIGTSADGTQAVANATGVSVTSDFNQIAGNLVSGNSLAGIQLIGGATGSIVSSNLVGTDADGTGAIPNHDGIDIGNAPMNHITSNLVSGNTNVGIGIIGANASGNTVAGNYIGTSRDGLSALGNAYGIDINAAPNTVVGGSTSAARNIIAGNTSVGIELEGVATTGTVVAGNFIGTNLSGAALGNGQSGVQIVDAVSNTIGGAAAAAANVIAFNGQSGVRLVSAVGTPVNNAILSNSIHSNAGWGIDLGLIPTNDAGDGDTGPNNLQNYPVVASASTTSVSGSLSSAPNQPFTVQLFENAVCDPSLFGEGQTLIDSFTVTTDGDGHAGFLRSDLTLTTGRFITATATDENGNTSAFSACTVVNPTIALTPDPLAIVTNTSAPMTVTLSQPAGAGGQTVTLASNDPVAAVQPSILIPEGASSGTATITTGSAAGSAIITAAAAGFQGDTATVNVSLRTMTLSAPSALVGVGRSLTGTITLQEPAPAGGLAVTLTSSHTNFVTVSPPTVTIAQGGTSGTFTIDGIAAGSSTITGTAAGAADATLVITATTSSLISLGIPPVVAPGQSAGVAVSLGIDAPAGGVTISFVSSDTDVVTITGSVFVPAGQRIPAANPQITGVMPGTASLTASAPGFAPDNRTATVTLTLSFTPASGFAVIAGRTSNITLNLSSPAPSGGLTLNTSIDNTALATVPPTVTAAAGSTSVAVPVTGVAVGNTTVRASGTGIAQASAPVRVDPTPPINIGDATIGKDLQMGLSGSLGLAAPAGGVTVTIRSLDPSKVLLATSATAAGSASITRTVNAGSTFIATFWVQALAGADTAQIETTANGYVTDTSTVTFHPSGFILNAGNISTNTRAANTSVRIDAARLNPATLRWSQTQELRPGATATVAVASSNPAVGAIVGSPAVFAGGDSFRTVSFDPATVGSTTISLTPPTGFTTPSELQSITATVEDPAINIGNATVGKDLQVLLSGSLEAPAPVGNLQVTIRSLDAGKLLLSTSATGTGSASITLQVNAGLSSIPSFYVQALADTGTVDFEATAPGYAPDTSTVTLHPSGFVLNANNFSTNTFAANTTIRIDAARLNPANLRWSVTQELRGGLTVDVTATNSNPTVGTLTGSPATFTGGNSFRNLTFDPSEAGMTTISLSAPAGFSTPGDFQSVVATVTAPNITIGNATVGRDLQMLVSITLGATPPNPVTVTVTSNDPSVATLTRDGTVAGGTSVTFTNVTSSFVGNVYVQGRAHGTTTLTAEAAGYNDGTGNVTVDPSGLVLNSNNFTTNTFAPDVTIRVDAARLHPTTLRWATSQELRGGLTVSAEVTSSDTNVGTIIGSPATINGGDSFSNAIRFHPRTAGPTTISIATPPGFTTPSDFQSVVATVTAPDITIGNATVGRDLQMQVSVSLGATPPNPVTVTVRSNSTALATVTRDGTVAGGASVTFTNVTSSFVGTLYVQGRGLGTTTLTVEAAGYNDGTSNVTVDPSGFILNSNDITTNTFAANTSIRIDAARLHPTTLAWSSTQELRGGLSVNVPVTSSNTAVGTIVGSPAVFTGGDFFRNVAFDPAASGTTTISAATPAGFSTPSTLQSITATVNAPTIFISNAVVGRDLQTSLSITLESAPPSPVTVTVTSNDGGIATITRDGTVAGGTSVTFTNVSGTNVGSIVIQGRALGGTTLTLQAPDYTPGSGSVTVDPSGFVLNMGNITTTAGAANTALRIDAARLNPTTFSWTQTQEVRGGLNVNVPVTSSNTAVGTIVGSPVAFAPGDAFKTTGAFDPAAAGTTTITVMTPAGFTTPSGFTAITATVNP